jgi:membrane-bound lytic murein transglycosylase B
MKKINITSILKRILVSLALCLPFAAQAYTPSNCLSFTFDGWKECICDHFAGLDNSLNYEPILKAEYLDRAIELDNKQPEKKMDLDGYLKIIDIKQKIALAKKYKNENLALLKEVGAKYGVEPEVIVALITMESSQGKRMGNFDIISSLSTLAYDGRRRTFFEQELFEAIKVHNILERQGREFKGSWAGAMGQCQFMPSSYNKLAIDHDKDGFADIWENKSDVYASVANYLHENGWKAGASAIKQASKAEIKKCKGKEKCAIGSKRLISVQKNDIISHYYLVGSNYDVLMRWNRSKYFVIAVLKITNSIS